MTSSTRQVSSGLWVGVDFHYSEISVGRGRISVLNFQMLSYIFVRKNVWWVIHEMNENDQYRKPGLL